jgi:transposase
MTDEFKDLADRLVVGHKRDGRSVYDEQAKLELVMACRRPGVSVARVARECGINANQLSRWLREHEQRSAPVAASAAVDPAPAFVAVRVEAPTSPADCGSGARLQARS